MLPVLTRGHNTTSLSPFFYLSFNSFLSFFLPNPSLIPNLGHQEDTEWSLLMANLPQSNFKMKAGSQRIGPKRKCGYKKDFLFFKCVNGLLEQRESKKKKKRLQVTLAYGKFGALACLRGNN